MKGRVRNKAVISAMIRGREAVALTKRRKANLKVAELKVQRFSLGMTRIHLIRNKYITKTQVTGMVR